MGIFGKKPEQEPVTPAAAEQPATTPAPTRPAFGGSLGSGAFGGSKPAFGRGKTTAPAAASPSTPAPATSPPSSSPAAPKTAMEVFRASRLGAPAGVAATADEEPRVSYAAQAALTSPTAQATLGTGEWLTKIQAWHSDWISADIEERGVILRQQLDGLSELAAEHLQELETDHANVPALKELGLLLKLTYARLREHPSADKIMVDKDVRTAGIVARKLASAKARAASSKAEAREASRNSTITDANLAAFAGL